MGGSSFSLTMGGGGAGKNLQRNISLFKGVGRLPPGDLFYFQKALSCNLRHTGTACLSVYRQFIRKPVIKMMIFFSKGGLATPALPLDPPLLIYLHLQLSSLPYFFFSYSSLWGTGMIASSSNFRPHPGRVIRDLFRLLDAVTALYGSTSLQQSSKGSCSLLVSGYILRADCQWRTLAPPLNSGANAAPASVLALM